MGVHKLRGNSREKNSNHKVKVKMETEHSWRTIQSFLRLIGTGSFSILGPHDQNFLVRINNENFLRGATKRNTR